MRKGGVRSKGKVKKIIVRKRDMNDVFFFQAEDGIRDLVRSRGLGDVYKRQAITTATVG